MTRGTETVCVRTDTLLFKTMYSLYTQGTVCLLLTMYTQVTAVTVVCPDSTDIPTVNPASAPLRYTIYLNSNNNNWRP